MDNLPNTLRLKRFAVQVLIDRQKGDWRTIDFQDTMRNVFRLRQPHAPLRVLDTHQKTITYMAHERK